MASMRLMVDRPTNRTDGLMIRDGTNNEMGIFVYKTFVNDRFRTHDDRALCVGAYSLQITT